MMPGKTALSRYGPMDPGDVRSVPKVDASSVDIFLSAYALWSQVVDGEAIADRGTGIDASYDAAVKLLRPHAGTFANLAPDGLEQAIAALETEHNPVLGIFLSAALNTTELRALAGVFREYSFLGYKLAPGKVLVARKGSSVHELGVLAEGGVLISYGMVDSFASYAKGGVQANLGFASNFGDWSSNSVRINLGNKPGTYSGNEVKKFLNHTDDLERLSCPSRQGGYCDGVDINTGRMTGSFSEETDDKSKCFVANFGRVEGWLIPSPCDFVNCGTIETVHFEEHNPGKPSRFVNLGILRNTYSPGFMHEGSMDSRANRKSNKGIAPVMRQMRAKVRWLDGVLSPRAGAMAEPVDRIAAYDWAGFEADVRRLAGEARAEFAQR